MPATGTDGNEFFYAPEGYADKGDSQENHAKFYAEWNGAKQYILDNLPYTPRNLNDLMYSQDNEECKARIIAEAHENGVPLTERGLEDLWLDGRHMRPGVTIAISQDIERDYEQRTPIDRNQRSIMTENGLLLKYIVGIEPMGNYEWERLQRLQDLLDDSPPE